LELTHGNPADAANSGLSTVVDFEKKRRQVSAAAVRAIRDALIARGVEFIDENGGGPGVRYERGTKRRPQLSRRCEEALLLLTRRSFTLSRRQRAMEDHHGYLA
jgi:hypothetical protein